MFKRLWQMLARSATRAEQLASRVEEPSVIEQVHHAIAKGKQTREELEHWAEQMVELHGIDPDEPNADYFRDVIYCGEDYSTALRKSINYMAMNAHRKSK